jgi:hypothetical protein
MNSVHSYGLEYTVYRCGYKEGMGQAVKEGVSAVLMGVRKGDPWTGESSHFLPPVACHIDRSTHDILCTAMLALPWSSVHPIALFIHLL